MREYVGLEVYKIIFLGMQWGLQCSPSSTSSGVVSIISCRTPTAGLFDQETLLVYSHDIPMSQTVYVRLSLIVRQLKCITFVPMKVIDCSLSSKLNFLR